MGQVGDRRREQGDRGTGGGDTHQYVHFCLADLTERKQSNTVGPLTLMRGKT